MGFIHGANRHAERLVPERRDDAIAEEHSVRGVDAFVDPLNLTPRGCQRATPAATGRPADPPAALLQLYLEGALCRLRARRRLEQGPHRHGELRWLWQQLRPAHPTRADCRKHHLTPLRQVCRAVTLLGQQLDRLAGTRVAIDGSKCKAGNATERPCTADKLQPLLQQSDQRVEASRKDLDGQESAEEAGTPGGAVVDNGPAKLAAL